ncbi:hypothetical protein VNO78_09364 [Psophocarpus tetragonolobus]|uniref:Probable 6-phosphogluconolactonase n=1 Tax=Psophocarpus tetragonolobus TaxID=3891 RepID=A0AAN9XTH2_PSOTE
MALSGGQNNKGDIRIHESLDELRTDLADYVAELSEASVKEQGVLAIALSGGCLIGLMGQWTGLSKWYIFWADERVVAENHTDSNYKLAKDVLCLRHKEQLEKIQKKEAALLYAQPWHVPIIPSHVHSINDSVSAEEAADDYEFVIRQLVKSRVVKVSEISDCPKFDPVLLGLRPDGHVASLFPSHPALNESEEWVTFNTDSPKPPPERITFTLLVINSASNFAVVVTGESKAESVHLAIDDVRPDFPLIPQDWSNQQCGSWCGFWISWLPQNLKTSI